MTIAFRNKTQGGGGTGASAVATPPTGLANDDILLFWIYKENAAAITWPSGFTQVGAIAASNSSFSFYVAWKRAASESGNYTASWTGSVWRNWGFAAYSGCVTGTSPMDATPTTIANGSSGSGTCPSITTITNGAMLVCANANFDGAFSTGYPSGMSGRVTQDNDLGIADLPITTAGATGSKVFTLTLSSQNVGISLALTPAGGGTTYTDTGGATSVATGSGADVATLVDVGSAVSPFTGSGADTAVLLDTGAAISVATGSGADVVILVDAGTAELGATGSGVDTALFQDSATATSALTASGADAAVYSDAASATAILVGSGVDAPEYADTGTGTLGAIGSGDDSNAYIDTGGATLGATGSGASATVFSDAGQAQLGAAGSGADAATFSDTGTAASALTGSGSDAHIYEDTGAGLAALFGAGSDIAILTDSGTGVLVAIGSGSDDAPGVFVPGTIRGPGAAGSIFAPLTAGRTRSPKPTGTIKG